MFAIPLAFDHGLRPQNWQFSQHTFFAVIYIHMYFVKIVRETRLFRGDGDRKGWHFCMKDGFLKVAAATPNLCVFHKWHTKHNKNIFFCGLFQHGAKPIHRRQKQRILQKQIAASITCYNVSAVRKILRESRKKIKIKK